MSLIPVANKKIGYQVLCILKNQRIHVLSLLQLKKMKQNLSEEDEAEVEAFLMKQNLSLQFICTDLVTTRRPMLHSSCSIRAVRTFFFLSPISHSKELTKAIPSL